MGLTYEMRWEIRWARDRQARWRVWREDIIAHEIEMLEAEQKSLRDQARREREYAWALSLPGLLAEWRAREESS